LEENYRLDVLFVRVYPADGFLPFADAVKTASARQFFSIFNFWFSVPKIPKIPKIPKLPELCGLRGRSREKKKVFSA
jgi:hypothetical protein